MVKFFGVLCVVGVAVIASCLAEPPRPRSLQRVRFPGAAVNRPLPFLARQEAPDAAADAPYPPAGLKPQPAFELPTEEAANFPGEPEPTYGPPDQTYGPPDQTYGPPDQTYGPPDETYGPPDETYGPPDETYGPPDETYGPPDETYGPPDQTYDPPAVDTGNGLPQSASILASNDFFPKTYLTLPRPERLVAFRPQQQRRPAPVRRPTNIRRPAKLRRPVPPKPAKLVINFGSNPSAGFAQLPPIARNPIYKNGRIIAYSDRLQSW